MKFEIISKKALEDKTQRIILRVATEDLIYLGYILESFEGWCNYTTIKKHEPFLQIDLSPDYSSSMEELLSFLRNWDYGN